MAHDPTTLARWLHDRVVCQAPWIHDAPVKSVPGPCLKRVCESGSPGLLHRGAGGESAHQGTPRVGVRWGARGLGSGCHGPLARRRPRDAHGC